MATTDIDMNTVEADMSTVEAVTGTSIGEEEIQPAWQKALIAIVLLAITFLTVAGNTVILLAFYFEKKLRNTFTLLAANLAVTDLLVGLIAMFFYIFDTVLGYWPFGEFVCGIWIFFDYAMTFASVFTLVAISVDRYWAVKSAISYRANNNTKKAVIMIVLIWGAVLGIWFPPFVLDRKLRSEPGVCYWDPAQNEEFVLLIAIIGHHLPCFIIIYCYVCVAKITRQKFRAVVGSKAITLKTTNSDTVSCTNKSSNSPGVSTIAHSHSPSQPHSSSPDKNETKVVIHKESSSSKERKIFATLTSILATYLICWVPFHIIFDMSIVDNSSVSPRWYTFGFWLAYLNSTLNPIVYVYSNPDFRKAFKQVICCHYFSCKKTRSN